MRQRLSFYLAALVAFAGCAGGDSPQAPSATEPTQIGAPQAAPPQVPNPMCAPITPLAIGTEIVQLFLKANLDSDRRDVLEGLFGIIGGLAGFSRVQIQVAQGNVAGARKTTGLLVKFLTTKFKRLSTAKQVANQAAFDKLIGHLWCYVGISGKVFELNPGDPAKAIDLPAVGGVAFPANVVPVGTLVSITDLSGGPCPVSTVLDCFPGFLSITLFPPTTLTQPATVVLCPPANAPPTVVIGHQDPTAGFEILPPVPVPALLAATCSSLGSVKTGPAAWFAKVLEEATNVLLPAKLEAAMPVSFLGGIGGITSRFSPFAVVNPVVGAVGGLGGKVTSFAPQTSSAAPSTSARNAAPDAAPVLNNPPLPPLYFSGGVGGGPVFTGLPTVTLKTPGGDLDGSNPVPGVTVTFTTSASLLYDPDSNAKVCDALGNVPANNTVTAVTNASGVATLPCIVYGNKTGFANLAASFNPASLNFPNANLVSIQTSDGQGGSGNTLNWLVQTVTGLPTQLGIITAPSGSAQAGVPLAIQPSFQLLDAFGNEVYAAGIAVTVAVTQGGGVPTSSPVTTDANGVATFTNLKVGGPVAGVGQTLSFSFSGIGQPVTAALQITAGPASQLAITRQPSSTAGIGLAFAQQPQVTIQDQFGNVLTSSGASITASLASGAPALAGTTSVNASGGVADFSDLNITPTTGPRTLQFTLGAIVSNPTNTIDVDLTQTPATLPVAFLSSGYLYKVVAATDEPSFPASFGSGGFTLGSASFGSPASGCTLNNSVQTTWPTGSDVAPSDILVLKQITVPAATSITITLQIDNDYRIWIDGVAVTDDPSPNGFHLHEGCAGTNGPNPFVVNLATPGVHTIAIRGRDRGGQAYLDVQVTP